MKGRVVVVCPLQEDFVEASATLIADLPLYQQYGFDFEKAKSALAGALKASHGEILIAKVDGQIVGVAWFIKDGGFARSGYLRLIAVSEEFQCSGVGRKLIEALEAKHLKPNGIFILATSTNAHAREFYEKLGYAKVGEIPDFVKPGLTETVYFKK